LAWGGLAALALREPTSRHTSWLRRCQFSTRNRRFAWHPAQDVNFLACELTGQSYMAICRAFGRDHTAILGANNSIFALANEFPNPVGDDLLALRARIKAVSPVSSP
jgi:hypothetical protein